MRAAINRGRRVPEEEAIVSGGVGEKPHGGLVVEVEFEFARVHTDFERLPVLNERARGDFADFEGRNPALMLFVLFCGA